MSADALLALALQWHRFATDAAATSRMLAAAGAPMSHVSEALAIGRRALELAKRLEELADKAAPMPRRD